LSNFAGTRTEYTAEFTKSGSSKVDTTLNVAQDKFTNAFLGHGNTAATEFNWTYDPDNGLEDGDIVKEIASGSPTGKLFMLDIEPTNTPIKYSLIPVKKDGDDWVYEGANSGSTVTGGSGLSDLSLIREVSSKPTGTGESISDSAALTILKAAGVIVSVYGDEKGGSTAFSAGTHDASESASTSDSDGIGLVLKGVKAFGEITADNGTVSVVGVKTDIDVFALINSLSSPTLIENQKYKVTVAKEAWDGSDNGKTIDFLKVLKGNSSTSNDADESNEFIADGTSDYYLQINGKGNEDAQYSVFLDIV
jgi:hypothetical protein